MSENRMSAIKEICKTCGNARTRMMDIVRAVQQQFGQVGDEAMNLIAKYVNCRRVEVESVVSFYAFLSKEPKGRVVIRLCSDVVDKMSGVEAVAAAFEKELGIKFGQTTADGKITLEYAPCIGMCDQAPAALINDEIITYLSTDKVREIVADIKKHYDPSK